jgi:hypothetical protein
MGIWTTTKTGFYEKYPRVYGVSQSNELQNYLRLSASICVQLLLLVPQLNGNGYSISNFR